MGAANVKKRRFCQKCYTIHEMTAQELKNHDDREPAKPRPPRVDQVRITPVVSGDSVDVAAIASLLTMHRLGRRRVPN